MLNAHKFTANSNIKSALLILILTLLTALTGCSKKAPQQAENTGKLVLISPHNENIQYEFENAFKKYAKQNLGKDVQFEWRNVGGGTSAILRYIENTYSRAETSGIDILFGGGEYPYQYLTEKGLLEKIQIDPNILQNIPARFSGMAFYNPDMYWVGDTLSGFGIIYNTELLEQIGLEPPKTWDDLAKPQYFDLIMLADPTQSGSAAATYEMILQTEDDWQNGWAKLLGILANAKDFTDSAGDSANAPAIGQAPIATCIDFYGIMRVAEAPEKLTYINPKNQTGFTPDPIAMLKNPPSKKLAQEFINFVLSMEGQALWALPVGAEKGPERKPLGRPPIRKDFYDKYQGQMLKDLKNPYITGAGMEIDSNLRHLRYGIMKQFIKAAAIANNDGIKAARKYLIQNNFPEEKLKTFKKLPDNMDTLEDIKVTVKKLDDPREAEIITSGWTKYFRDKYNRITE